MSQYNVKLPLGKIGRISCMAVDTNKNRLYLGDSEKSKLKYISLESLVYCGEYGLDTGPVSALVVTEPGRMYFVKTEYPHCIYAQGRDRQSYTIRSDGKRYRNITSFCMLDKAQSLVSCAYGDDSIVTESLSPKGDALIKVHIKEDDACSEEEYPITFTNCIYDLGKITHDPDTGKLMDQVCNFFGCNYERDIVFTFQYEICAAGYIGNDTLSSNEVFTIKNPFLLAFDKISRTLYVVHETYKVSRILYANREISHFATFSEPVTAILTDPQSRVFVATGNKLFCFEGDYNYKKPKTLKRVHPPDVSQREAMARDMKHDYTDVKTHDFTFCVGNEYITAHTYILHYHTDFFAYLLDKKDQHEINEYSYTLDGRNPEAVRLVVRYMYTFEIHLNGEELDVKVHTLNLAHAFQINPLEQRIKLHFAQIITIYTVLAVTDIAIALHCDCLLPVITDFIRKNLVMLKTQAFDVLSTISKKYPQLLAPLVLE